MIGTSSFLDALGCRNHDAAPPLWLMRQAGRYMPEYRQLRRRHRFLDLCHTPELAAEVTLLPIKRFGMDAAILFSDILVIPEALGVGLDFDEGKGPVIANRIASERQIAELPDPDISEALGYVAETIRLLKPELEVPLIGFAGAPFTVASYMIEGGSSRTLQKTKQMLFSAPQQFHTLLDKIAKLTADYLNMQIRAGADVLQLFDSWANYLGPAQFEEFSLFYMKKIMERLESREVPLILFCKGSSLFAQKLAEARPAAISLDWNGDMAKIRKAVPHPIALQGNLDPDILCSSKEAIVKETRRILDGMKGDPGFIFNLGHGIRPDTPPEHVQLLIETVRCAS